MKYSFLILITLIHLSLHAQKKVKIDTSLKPLQYLLHILDTTNVKINNLKFRGLKSSLGRFNIQVDSFEIKEGIVFTTGNLNTLGGEIKRLGPVV